MRVRRNAGIEIIPREMIERMAALIGPGSASAQALAEANKHDGPVTFFAHANTIVVQKHSKEPQQ